MSRVSIGPQRIPAGVYPHGVPITRRSFVHCYVRSTWDEDWVFAPYLLAITANRNGIHASSEAEFELDYGLLKLEYETSASVHVPMTERGWYVAMRVIPPIPWTPFAAWCGVIPADALAVLGTRTVGAANVAAGKQTIAGYGLDHILRGRRLHETFVARPDLGDEDPTIWDQIQSVLAFNERPRRGFQIRGNRSPYRYIVDGPTTIPPVYLFGHSDAPWPNGELWSNREIINYALTFSEDITDWETRAEPHVLLGGNEDVLAFLDTMKPVFSPGRKTVLEIVQQLIDRRRGLGASIEWAVDGLWGLPTGDLELRVFSLTGEDVVVGSGGHTVTLPANPVQEAISIDETRDVEKAKIVRSSLQTYATIVVQGEPMHTCFSAASSVKAEGKEISLAEERNIAPVRGGWSVGQEAAYKAAEDAERVLDKHNRVYRVFELGKSPVAPETVGGRFVWETVIAEEPEPPDDPPAEPIYLHPAFDDNGILDPSRNGEFANLDAHLVVNLPFVLASDIITESRELRFDTTRAIFELLDSAGAGSGFWVDASNPPAPADRYPGQTIATPRADVAATVTPLERGLGLDVHFRQMPHVAGRGTFDAGETPGTSQRFPKPVFDWRRMILTICAKTEHRPRIVVQTGASKGKLVLDIPDAHFWWVAPGTVSGIEDTGGPMIHPGGITRDDTDLLRLTAALAKSWYGTDRSLIQITQHGLTGALPVGTFISSVSAKGMYTDVGSVVSAQKWNFKNGTTEIRTGHLELDVRARR